MFYRAHVDSRPLFRILYRDHASDLSEHQLSESIYVDAIVHGLQLPIIHVTPRLLFRLPEMTAVVERNLKAGGLSFRFQIKRGLCVRASENRSEIVIKLKK